MAGFVKLNRELLGWTWADDIVTFGVYSKFLLLAAWKESEYHGVKLERGELLTNQSEIAKECSLTRQQVRTVLERLKATNKITTRRNGKNSIIKVIDYDCETDSNHIENHISTTCQPDCNQTTLLKEEYKEVEESKNAQARDGSGAEMPYFESSFERFWSAYPKKKARANALKVWLKLKPNKELVAVILSALEQQKQSADWLKDNGQYIPYPTTWLNGKRWEDGITEVNGSGRNAVNSSHTRSAEDWLKGFNG